MQMICVAVVDSDKQRANLCECVRIIGGVPKVDGKTVYVEYSGPEDTADKYKELFSQFPVNGITTIS